MEFARRLRAAYAAFQKRVPLSGVDSSRGWRTLFESERDSFQIDRETLSDERVLANGPVYACTTLIASDVGKVCLRLMQEDQEVWVETESSQFSPLLRKPNHYQTRQQFIESWVISKLLRGNAYVFKDRDRSNRVKALYVLDPDRVTPLVAPNGDVFYGIQHDELSKLPTDFEAIPAYEIIHDRMECLFHPLVGISPLFAAHLAASQGLRIQRNSERFFRNMSRPSGILTSPHEISPQTAERIKKAWDEKYGRGGIGGTAVVGDGLTYVAMTVSAVDAQLVEQLKLSAEQICSVFHVPPYMIGVGATPTYNNIQALNQQYYSQCLQKIFNAIEDLIDDGLNLLPQYRTEFDLDDLLRMDSTAQADFVTKLVKGSVMTPNWGRRKFGELPIEGGDTVYMQHQDYSIAALAKRDAKDDPFGTATPAAPAPAPSEDEEKAALETARLIASFTKGLECLTEKP